MYGAGAYYEKIIITCCSIEMMLTGVMLQLVQKFSGPRP